MKGITYCGACADYDIKKHRCKRGAKLESNPQDKFFDDCPLPDAVPVVNGRWAHLGGDEWCCSACGFVITTEGSWDKPTKKHCEDCGARMDGDGDGKAD